MAIRSEINAIDRGAAKAQPVHAPVRAAFILGGLKLLTRP
jgi:hypothetical protein